MFGLGSSNNEQAGHDLAASISGRLIRLGGANGGNGAGRAIPGAKAEWPRRVVKRPSPERRQRRERADSGRSRKRHLWNRKTPSGHSDLTKV